MTLSDLRRLLVGPLGVLDETLVGTGRQRPSLPFPNIMLPFGQIYPNQRRTLDAGEAPQ